MKPSALLISEKYCDANPLFGRSDTLHITYKPMLQSQCFSKVDHLYIDIPNLEINKQIIKNYDYYVFSFLGNSDLNPNNKLISNLPGKKIFIWPDTVWPWIYDAINRINQYASLHVSYDIPPENLINFCKPKNILFLGQPLDQDLYKPGNNNIYDVSFIGSIYNERADYLKALIDNTDEISRRINRKFKYYIGQGNRNGYITKENYVQILRNSRIGLGFSSSPTGKDQLKSRVHEIITCNAMLLQSQSLETRKWINNIVEFNSIENMIEKIVFYLNNDDKRITIADQANKELNSKCNPSIYWQKILRITNEI